MPKEKFTKAAQHAEQAVDYAIEGKKEAARGVLAWLNAPMTVRRWYVGVAAIGLVIVAVAF